MSTIDTPAAVTDPFAQAQEVLAGGVSASMRLNPYLGRPLYTQRGSAPTFGLDGTRYIDFNMSNGAALLGHDHPAVKEAVLHGVELGIIVRRKHPSTRSWRRASSRSSPPPSACASPVLAAR